MFDADLLLDVALRLDMVMYAPLRHRVSSTLLKTNSINSITSQQGTEIAFLDVQRYLPLWLESNKQPERNDICIKQYFVMYTVTDDDNIKLRWNNLGNV